MDGERLFELRRRTFDTPEFRGMEFIETEAKTVINHVPGNFMPFSWTINPYRGCSHACSYCLAPETPILMGDSRTRPIQTLRPGDTVYGTTRQGRYRRLVKTQVLAHWRTRKPAFRITLEDGTELLSSGDHRFLTERGWKHVTPAAQPDQRPHLRTNNELLGVGAFAHMPKEGADYRRGYLAGMIRGDGTLGTYRYRRASGRPAVVHRFRLALVDLEGLRRAKEYLRDINIETDGFLLSAAAGSHRAVHAIRTSRARDVDVIREVIDWPTYLTDDWCRGYLAGIFDAEGSYSRGILRIANTDPAIIDCTRASLENLGFQVSIDVSRNENGLRYVRLLGGLATALRFFHTTNPAISRRLNIEGQAIKNKARLRVTSIESLGVVLPMYDITTGTGDFIANGVVSHNCFARPTHTFMEMNAGRDFETKIVVKVNAPEVLRRQLASKGWKGEHIAMGTATDPYQRAEGRYRLMPGIIEAMIAYRNPFSILTKGTLMLRDLPLLKEAAAVTDVSTAFSIPTLDDDAWKATEPGTPHPRARMDAVAELNDAGIPCGVMIAPLLPGITDHPDQIRAVVEAAIEAGATHVSPIHLHLRPGVREEFMAWLAGSYPDLVERYESMYRASAYGPPADRKETSRKVHAAVRRAGGLKPRPQIAERWRRGSDRRLRDTAPGGTPSAVAARAEAARVR